MGQKKALLIHNNSFVDQSFAPLHATDGDIKDLRDLLSAEYVGFDAKNIKELKNRPLSEVRTEISRFFADAKSDDYLFFYYAGHGIRGSEGDLYLALKRTQFEDYEAQALEARFIKRALRRCASEQKVVLLDCCNAGAFHTETGYVARDAEYDPGLYNAAFDPAGTGTYVLGASQSGASAYETTGKDGKSYSLFTKTFVEGVKTGAAAPSEEFIDLPDINRYLNDQRNAKGIATTPFWGTSNAKGVLRFARNPNRQEGEVIVKPAPTTPAPKSEISSNKKIITAIGIIALIAGVWLAVQYYLLPYDPRDPKIAYQGSYELADPTDNGLAFSIMERAENMPRNISTFSCSGGKASSFNCYPYGDQKPRKPSDGLLSCDHFYPLLCLSKEDINRPLDLPRTLNWTGGTFRATKPLIPPAKLSDAQKICRTEFGENFRVAEFHDGEFSLGQNDGRKWRFTGVGKFSTWKSDPLLYWIDINNQPSANCWVRS